jgi:acetyl esterase/lipase
MPKQAPKLKPKSKTTVVKPVSQIVLNEHEQNVRVWSVVALIVEILIIVVLVGYGIWLSRSKPIATQPSQPSKQIDETKPFVPQTGKILSDEVVTTYSTEQALSIIRQANQNFDATVSSPVQKRLIRYTSSNGQNNDVPIYARLYLPQTQSQPLPLMVFAPGTTGISDSCAASIENPAKRNWANYDSLLLAYAAQGYAVVITDYEGMRDPDRIHHYMVGELEGRAMLDAIRAVKNLDATKVSVNTDNSFVAGYSQGGHAAYWADQIQPSYAPDLSLRGSVGFGPVTDVEQTLADINRGANINWFGPFVLVSYTDWYKHVYPLERILQNRWIGNLRVDVLRECIDSVNHYWPNNIGSNRASTVYTPEFLQALRRGLRNSDPYKQLGEDMYQNIVGLVKTATPKRLNQGKHDNVILPAQSLAAINRFCQHGNVAQYVSYDTSRYGVTYYDGKGAVDHYRTMSASLFDTIAWMNDRIANKPAPNSCSN